MHAVKRLKGRFTYMKMYHFAKYILVYRARKMSSIIGRLNIDFPPPSSGSVMLHQEVMSLVAQSVMSANSHMSDMRICLSVCLTSQRTCLLPPTAPSKMHVPGHQTGTLEGGWGVKHHYIKLISWRLRCCTQRGLLCSIINAVSKQKNQKTEKMS